MWCEYGLLSFFKLYYVLLWVKPQVFMLSVLAHMDKVDWMKWNVNYAWIVVASKRCESSDACWRFHVSFLSRKWPSSRRSEPLLFFASIFHGLEFFQHTTYTPLPRPRCFCSSMLLLTHPVGVLSVSQAKEAEAWGQQMLDETKL